MEDMDELVREFEIPEVVVASNRCGMPGRDALRLVCYRFASPTTWMHAELVFRRRRSVLEAIYKTLVDLLFAK